MELFKGVKMCVNGGLINQWVSLVDIALFKGLNVEQVYESIERYWFMPY